MARLRVQHSRGSRGERGRACSEARGESEDPAGDQALSPARDSGGKGVPGLRAGGGLLPSVRSTPGRRQPPGKASVPTSGSTNGRADRTGRTGGRVGWGVAQKSAETITAMRFNPDHPSLMSLSRLWALRALPAP